MNYIKLLIILCLVNLLSAQTPIEELNSYKENFPDDNIIYEFTKDYVSFTMEENNLKAKLTSQEQTFLLSDRASYYAKDEISHTRLFKLIDIEAYSLIPGAKKYQLKKVNEFEEKDDLGGMSFYDDNRLTLFEYPLLTQGAKRYVSYSYDVVEPALIGQFRFAEISPIESASLQITTAPGIKLGYRFFNCEEIKIEETTDQNKNGSTTYTWTAKNVEKIEMEPGAPNYKYYAPHMLYYVQSYEKEDGTTENLLNGVEGLHNYYQNFLDSINKTADDDLKELVAEIVPEGTTELEKGKSNYQWVQNNIKYDDFEDGYGGFIPRQAKDIYKKRYGDCKDMASIIHEMLKYAGIESHWTWIGSRSIPYKYSEIATPAVDNHMINTYISDDKYYFLDGTGSDTPFGIPTSFIQGKEALINLNNDSFIIAEVPIIPSEINTIKDTAYLSIENGLLLGKAQVEFSGYHRNKIVNYLSDTDGDDRKGYVKNYVRKGSNKFELNDYTEFNKNDKDLPYRIEYNFTIPDHFIEVDEKMYINLNLEKYFADLKLEKDRKHGYEMDYKQKFINHYELKIPDGYEVEYLPESQSHDNAYFSFSTTTERLDDKIIMNQEVNMDFLILKKENFAEFDRYLKELKASYNEAIVLTK